MIERVALPALMPDQSVNSGVLSVARNVYAAADGYRPIKAVSAISDALTGEFKGGHSAIASDGSAYLLAGTDDALYKYETDGTWTSLISGLSVTGRWRFVQFGDYVVAVNGGATREVDLAGSTAGSIAGAPSGTSVAVIGDHVVIGQAGGDISLVQWCAFRNHTAWVDGTDQAGSQPMLTGGSVEYIAGGEYGVILQRERITRMTRTGDSSAPFEFSEISANFGCANAATVAHAGRTIFFLSDRGFMALDDGQDLRPIGSEKVDRTFAASVASDDYSSIYAAIDPENKLVAWCIPGTPGTQWIYNWELERWTTAELTHKGLFPGFTTSSGIDDSGPDDADLDAADQPSLDDPRYSGGNPRFYVVDGNNKVGTYSGDTLAAQFDLGFTEFAKTKRARVREIRPHCDATSGLTVVMDARARLGDSASRTTASTLRTSGVVPIRTSGRYISTSLRLAAATSWSYIQGFDIEFYAGGGR